MKKVSFKKREEMWKLAAQIEQFAFESEPREYLVSRQEREQCVEDIVGDIADGNTEYLATYIVAETYKRKNHLDFSKECVADALNMIVRLTQLTKE